jgi:hypothetical protein
MVILITPEPPMLLAWRVVSLLHIQWSILVEVVLAGNIGQELILRSFTVNFGSFQKS